MEKNVEQECETCDEAVDRLEAENERLRKLVWGVMHNLKPEPRNRERWVAVTHRFAIGSTMAYALCREFGLDPDEKLK